MNGSSDEIRAFMLRNGCGILFSRQGLSRAENILNFNPKVAATTAMQAFEPHQIVRRQLFWNSPPPIGIRNVPTLELIDCDEAAFGLGVVNRKKGKSFSGVLIRNPGLYGRFIKYTLILAVGADGLFMFDFDRLMSQLPKHFSNSSLQCLRDCRLHVQLCLIF